MLVEVMRRNFLASIVPVIVNAILNTHQIVVDIVAFVGRGDFPRSRLGEKQRGKILGSWVTRKMRTIAQFGIKDPDGPENSMTEVGIPRRSGHSFRSASMRGGAGSSLKHVESSSGLADLQEREYAPMPESVSELPAMDDSSIMESPPQPQHQPQRRGHDSVHTTQEDMTPTSLKPRIPETSFDFAPVELPADEFMTQEETEHFNQQLQQPHQSTAGTTPFLSLASIDGRGSLMADDDVDYGSSSYNRGQGGGLSVTNQSSADQTPNWPIDASTYSNLSGGNIYGHGR